MKDLIHNDNNCRCISETEHICCVIDRWNCTCVCQKCRLCSYCHGVILEDEMKEWEKAFPDYNNRFFLTNIHYKCAKTSIIDPLICSMLENIKNEQKRVQT